MSQQKSQSLLDQEPYLSEIKTWIAEGESNRAIATALTRAGLDTTKDSVRRFRKRHGMEVPTRDKASIKINGDEAVLITAPKGGRHMDDPDAMLEERGLSPEDWLIQGATINEWDGPQEGGSVITYHQAKLVLKRRQPELQIVAARAEGWKAPPRKPPANTDSELWVVTGDQQAPFHDEELHYLFCGWLEHNEPDHGIALGDKVDFPDISKHKLDPENTAKVNECIQSGYDLFRDYVDASPDTEWDLMPGNHDLRIRDLLLNKPSVTPLYGIRQADGEDEGVEVLSLSHLLRLDELGVNYVDPHGPYELAQINIGDKLAVRHGWIVRQGSGSSALASLEHLGYSIITGHTHRQSVVHKTKHEIDGTLRQIVGVEAGCMCRVNQTILNGRKFPDFVTAPDWMQGFATVQRYPDDSFKIDLATYVNKSLYWRDERFS